MNLDTDSELLIRRYLLASVSEQEREHVETRLMNDEDFLQHINMVEDELIEQYLDEQLDAADSARFETVFLSAPERRQKLRFTRALRVRAAAPADPKARVRVWKNPWWKPLIDIFNVPRPALAYSMAAALLVMALAGAWLLVQISGLKEEVAGLRAQQQNRDSVESSLRAQITKDKELLAIALQQSEKRFALPDPSLSHPWFTLSAGIQRSAQSSLTCEIPREAQVVGLKLDLTERRYSSYRAVLTDGSREILSRGNLKAEVSEKAITVSLRVPADDLPSRYCEVRLYGDGEKEPSETFPFRVVRK